MKLWIKNALFILLSFLCLLTGIGYAQLSREMMISGVARAEPADFDSMVITNVALCAGTTASASTNRILPTNVSTTITGKAGDKIVYKITARNDSEENTYVFAGVKYDTSYESVAKHLTVSTSDDEQGTSVIPASSGVNYYQGTPVAPGEEIVFYATYTLKSDMSGANIIMNFDFVPVVYTVTYMEVNDVYAVDCIVDNSFEYIVRSDGPDNGSRVFANWINANADSVYYYPVGNVNSYTLSAKWDNVYLIMFVDNDGTVIYEESFTESSTKLSAAGQAIVDAKLAELAREAAKDDMTVSWSSYNIANATGDIIVRALYTYTGNLRFTPIDEDGDGITDHYQVDAVAKLKDPTIIPGEYMGLFVEVINKLYLNDNNFDYGAGVNTIEIGEGVRQLNANSLAYTADLDLVKLPSTIETIGKNAFSRNWSDDKKVLTIEFNGTRAEWKAIVANSHEDWHNGLKDGSKVICTDGYFELDRGFLGLGGYTWDEHSN